MIAIAIHNPYAVIINFAAQIAFVCFDIFKEKTFSNPKIRFFLNINDYTWYKSNKVRKMY